jgi:hypothetical protein
MNRKRVISLALGLLCALALTGSALAMSSDNYRLDWFTPLTGSGGGPGGSTHYAVNFTVGQTAIRVASSANYQACLGYWCGTGRQWRVYLPLILSGFVDTTEVINLGDPRFSASGCGDATTTGSIAEGEASLSVVGAETWQTSHGDEVTGLEH